MIHCECDPPHLLLKCLNLFCQFDQNTKNKFLLKETSGFAVKSVLDPWPNLAEGLKWPIPPGLSVNPSLLDKDGLVGIQPEIVCAPMQCNEILPPTLLQHQKAKERSLEKKRKKFIAQLGSLYVDMHHQKPLFEISINHSVTHKL